MSQLEIADEQLINMIFHQSVSKYRIIVNAEISGPHNVEAQIGENVPEIKLFSALFCKDGTNKSVLLQGMMTTLFNCLTNLNFSYTNIVYGNKENKY